MTASMPVVEHKVRDILGLLCIELAEYRYTTKKSVGGRPTGLNLSIIAQSSSLLKAF